MWKKILFLLLLTIAITTIGFLGNKDVFVGKKVDVIEPENKTIKIFFVGDIMLSRQIGKIIDSKNEPKFPFELIASYLNTADLVVANLENPVSLRGKKVGSIYSFRANPKNLSGLNFANISLVTLANNHIWDYGREAFFDTLSHLASSSISVVGAGIDVEEAYRPFIFEKNKNKIAFLGFTNLAPSFLLDDDSAPAVASMETDKIKKAILDTKEKFNPDIVVAMFHWGEEYKTIHNSNQEYFAKVAVDSGANLVIGHHPHVVEDIGEYNGVPVVYSLGNFIFDQNFSEDTSKGMVFEVDIKDKKIIKTASQIVNFNKDFQPYIKNE